MEEILHQMEYRTTLPSSQGGEAIILAAGQPGMEFAAYSTGTAFNRRRTSGVKRTRFPAEINS